ncbi:4'-phosphopantetheinyl transferase superfamily protein [Actinomadura barringtoniae]|uniref:4'-phosphopantetheinyl transferase superfamily protein n=1 Tax=Actinomadura barringtoniae TaxID=1427535 RepID=A0A939PDD6_9ACTN|nr:4'-phosphopantetheinyl transferase superfamily protein [Actinomadura barringtoniae]MBO2447993.1 4'-phosphopantetheinyl transferase superfamily protein [Actinomadura barringtoniae]
MEPVAVWWAALSDVRQAHAGLLNEVERGRRERYLREPDRHRFTLGAAITRIAVGAMRGLAPENVAIDRSCADCGEQHGRPVIAGGPHVSVSHSGDRVAVAVSPYGPLGVDVEAAGRATEGIAGHLLAQDERDAQPLTPDAMLAYWTRKEALVKATGDGLRVPLTDLRVSPPTEAPRLLDWSGRAELVARITMVTLAPGTGYAACLALLDHPAGVEIVERPAAELLNP